MPNLYKRGDIWHYSFTVDGQRVRASSETSDKRIATDKAVEHERRDRRAAVHGPEAVTSFAQAVDLYLDAGKDSRYILPLLDHFRDTKLSKITPGMIRDAADVLYPKAGPATKNRQAITPAQAVINFAAEKGLCPHIRVRRHKVERKERTPGDKVWLAAFQRGAVAWEAGLQPQLQDGRGRRIAALARFMFETGARISQATALTWDDVHLEAGTATLRTRKTGPTGGVWERQAHLTIAMVAELANLPKLRKVFGYHDRNSVTRAWAAAIKTAGIAPLDRHEAGRHGFATEMIVRNGVDVPTAADTGGWRSRRLMLDTYAHPEGQKETVERVFGTPASHKRRKRQQIGDL